MRVLGYVMAVLFFLTISHTSAQQDSLSKSSYFLDQSALPAPKGSFVYNNYYLLANSVTYYITERIKASAGILLTGNRPPFYGTVQYSIPVGRDLFIGGSIGYYQIDYSEYRSNHLIVPQLLITKGNRLTNTTFSGGVVRGQFLWRTGFFSPAINLPSRVNLILSLSHQRPINRELSLITQNLYISAQAPAGSRYSEILMLSAGIGWHLQQRGILKAGAGALFFPDGDQNNRTSFLPFIGYSYTIK